MKRIISALMVIAISITLVIPAFAASDFLTNPELEKEHNYHQAEYDRLDNEIKALDAQFKKDNPNVNYYALVVSSESSDLWYNDLASIFNRIYYTDYHGIGYYVPGGLTTIYTPRDSYTARILLPDPHPDITKKYTTTRAKLIKERDAHGDAAENATISNIDQDGEMYRKIFLKYYEDPSIVMAFQIGNWTYYSRDYSSEYHIVNGTRTVTPYVKNGHTMIPLRCVIEGLGGTIDWDSNLNGARATLNGISITMPIGSDYATVNGTQVQMTTPAIVTGGRTMVPVRFVAETLGYDVNWVSDGAYVTISVSSKNYVSSYDYDIPDNYEQYGYSSGKYFNYYSNDMIEGTGQITIAYFDMNDPSDYSHFVSGLTRTNKYKVVDGMEVYEGWEYRDSDAPRASDTRRIALWYEGASVGLSITADYMKIENFDLESAIREAETEALSQNEAIEYIIPTVVPVFTSNLEQLKQHS